MARLQLLALLGSLVCSALADGYLYSHANPGTLTCSCCKGNDCYPNGCNNPKVFTKGVITFGLHRCSRMTFF